MKVLFYYLLYYTLAHGRYNFASWEKVHTRFSSLCNGALMRAPDIAPTVVFGGCRVALISTIYGLLVYLLSLIIRIVNKPRI